MIYPPKIAASFSQKSQRRIPREVTAIEYSPSFSFYDLNPSFGHTYNIFVDQRYISYMYAPVADRRIFGFIHYSPDSDLAAVVMHTGCLFADSKSKETTHRKFQTVTNLFEAMCCSETEYHKRACVTMIPNDVRLCGVMVTILILPSPPFFQAVSRNGIRSKEAPSSVFSFRICNFRIYTKYDTIPKIVAPNNYRSEIVIKPMFHLSFTGEVGIKYSKEVFYQFISCETVTNGLFLVYRVFIDANEKRYEIKDNEGSCQILRLIDPIFIDVLKRKTTTAVDAEIIEDNFVFDEIKPFDNSIKIRNTVIENVDTLLLMNIPGKMSRSPSMRMGDDK